MNYRKLFESFLKKVDLSSYREKYSRIKIVEMNLPKNIQAIRLLYQVYWIEKKFVSFDEFYIRYIKEHKEEIEEFRIKTEMCKKCFCRGLKARIYRTWAGLITQIQAGYVAEAVFGNDFVKMSEELDRKGADIQVNYKGHTLNYQVKKESFSGVVGRSIEPKTKLDGKFININYQVPNEDYFKTPKKLNGEFKLPYLRFIKDKRVKRLDNGFVIFTDEIFIKEKQKIDSKG